MKLKIKILLGFFLFVLGLSYSFADTYTGSVTNSGVFTFSQNCVNTLNYSGSILNTDCIYSIKYKDFQDFSFYTVIAVIVGIYIGFKFIRFVFDILTS